jgi:hypothetical protein
MAAKKGPDAPAEVVEAYDAMVASCPEAELKGATMPYTSLNGNMYSFVHGSGAVALRLPEEMRPAFLEQHGTKLFDAYGMVQKEYVTVPFELLAKTAEVAPYFQASHDYCKSLKPKKTTR